MLFAEFVIEPAYVVIAPFAVVIFFMVYVVCGAKNNVVVNVSFVNMGRNDIRIFPLKKSVRKLHANCVSFLIGNLSRHEGLYQMEGFVWIRLFCF